MWKVVSVRNVLCWGWIRCFFLLHMSHDMVELNPFDNLYLNDVALKNAAEDEEDCHSLAQSWRRKSWKWINSIFVLHLFPLSYCNLEHDHAMYWYVKCVGAAEGSCAIDYSLRQQVKGLTCVRRTLLKSGGAEGGWQLKGLQGGFRVRIHLLRFASFLRY